VSGAPRRLPIDAQHPGWLMLMGKMLRDVPRLEGALCADAERWRLFDAASGPEGPEARAAVALCARCPALNPCRAWVSSLSPPRKPPGITGGQFRQRGPVEPNIETHSPLERKAPCSIESLDHESQKL
jgi:hypothetical protein